MNNQNRPTWATGDRLSTRKFIKGYLLKHKVPPAMVDQMIVAMASDAMIEGTDAQYDRFFACIALTCKRVLGFDETQILNVLRGVDNIMVSVKNEEFSWNDIMDQCREETGYVMQTDAENRLVLEYVGVDQYDGKDVTREEAV